MERGDNLNEILSQTVVGESIEIEYQKSGENSKVGSRRHNKNVQNEKDGDVLPNFNIQKLVEDDKNTNKCNCEEDCDEVRKKDRKGRGECL